MKDYDINELKREVRITLDQNSTGGQLVSLADIDALMLESVIESKLTDAARVVEMNAPEYLLSPGKDADDTSVEWEVGNMGTITLPEDFMRLVVFEMSDWERPVVNAISATDPMYALQKSRWSGLKGTPERPVVAVVPGESGNVLEFYTCTDVGESVRMFQYVPIPKVDESGKLCLCERLKNAVVYYAAYLVALSMGENELAQALSGTANELMK